nr:probable GTP diphosphokinase CRSH, chloroplastic [Tanacetum cinerariifolium]
MNQMKAIAPVTTPFPENTRKVPFTFLVKINKKTSTLKNTTRLLRTIKSCISSTTTTSSIEAVSGGKMVVELVGTFNELTDRIKIKNNIDALSGSASDLLFNTLKLSLPILQSLPVATDGRSPLSRALSIALLLADLQVPALLRFKLNVDFQNANI